MCFPENFQKIFKNTLFIKPPCATASRTTNTFFLLLIKKILFNFLSPFSWGKTSEWRFGPIKREHFIRRNCHIGHGTMIRTGIISQKIPL